jgi:hypothetical protein
MYCHHSVNHTSPFTTVDADVIVRRLADMLPLTSDALTKGSVASDGARLALPRSTSLPV